MKLKISIFLTVFFIVLLFFAQSCNKNEGKKPAEETKVVEEAQQESSKISAEITDAIYVDIRAHQIYLPDKYTKKYGKKVQTDPETAEKFMADFNKEMEILYKEYNVTADAVDEYESKCSDNIEHFQKLMGQVHDHAAELKQADK